MSRNHEILLSGTVIYGDSFELLEGYICLKKGIISEVGEERVEADFEGIICPCFVNAHTHIGDSIIKDPPFLPISELVGPGGLKHRILAQTSPKIMIEGMKRTLLDMKATGTCAFADFREGGIDGVKLLSESLKSVSIEAKILGRPLENSQEMHESCWGLGISSTRDHDYKYLKDLVIAARARKQVVAIHAGEAGGDDVSDALSLGPDFLVHVCKAESNDIKKIASLEIPVVICPRSNLLNDVGLPNLKCLLQNEITVGVGTDNVMLNDPNMFNEMEFICIILLHDDRQVFKMCTLNGAKILGIDHRVGSIAENKEARVMVIDHNSNNMWGSSNHLASIVRRARPSDILAIF
ncbi:MAG: amidohydrolase family protein [Methanotrichaceae archaeon]|nr:amidohydrolase family protein [Methanotrichaceae archaeon]